jgi:hypothetical protein
MVLAGAVLLGLVVGLACGGRPGRLAELRLRGAPLFALAIGLQVVAYPPFPTPVVPSDRVATSLWLASYAIVILVALLNRRVRGFPLASLGMASNLVAVLANGGHMPALRSAQAAAGVAYQGVRDNSVTAVDPSLPWLIDRWGAPSWVPLANVYSVGDVLLAVGAIAIVSAGMGAHLPRLPGRRRSVPA